HYRLAVQTTSSTTDNNGSALSGDGSFSIELKDGVVWLTVTKPEGDGSAVRLEDILADGQGWPVDPIEKTTLAPIVERATGKPESIAVYGTTATEPIRVFVPPSRTNAHASCG